jgi:hypothetical protein
VSEVGRWQHVAENQPFSEFRVAEDMLLAARGQPGRFSSAPWVEMRNSQESRQVRERLRGIPAAIVVPTFFFE